MQSPQTDSAQELKQISAEIKEKFDEAGMEVVDAFVKALDEIQAMVGDSPDKVLQQMRELMEEFKEKLAEIEENPSSIAPTGIASCTSYYENRVLAKLKELKQGSHEMADKVKDLVSQIEDPMKNFEETLQKAIQEIEGTIKKLVKLPSDLDALSGRASAAEDVSRIDTGDIKKCLDTAVMECPLRPLLNIKKPLSAAIAKVKQESEHLMEFISNAPDRIREAFGMPQHLCFLQGMMMPQAPEAMTQLLDIVNKLSALKVDAMHELLSKISEVICDLDLESVSKPAKAFAGSATSHIDRLDKIVAGAKLTSNPSGKPSSSKALTPRSKMGSFRKIFGGA